MAQNSKYGYSTIGVQTTPETPVQTNTPISKIDGDILKTTEMVRNTSIQNRYNNASTIVNGNTTIEGDQNTELSPQDAVFALYGVLGKIQSQDVSSAGDGSVLKHTITKGGCELPSFSIEEKIGGCIGGNSDPSGQNTFVRRSFGCLYNSIALAIQEGILTLQNNIIAYGQFDVAFLRADESAEGSSVNITGGSFSDGTLTINATAHGLAVNDIIRITGTPAGIFRVASIINTNSFTIKIATNPGTPSGTLQKLAMFFFKTGQVKGLIAGDTVRFYARKTGVYEEVLVQYVDYDNDVVAFNSVSGTGFTVTNKTKIELVQKAIGYGTPQLFGLKNVKIKIGDTIEEARAGVEMDVNSLTLNVANNIESNSGTKYNVNKETGGDYTFDAEMLFNNLMNRDIFRNKEEQALIITIDNGNIISPTDTNHQTYKIEIEIYRFVYETQEIPTASGGLLTENATGLCLEDIDTGETIKFTVWNNKPAATYQPS